MGGEKSKWFDRRTHAVSLPVLPGMRDTSRVTAIQIGDLQHELLSNKLITAPTHRLFQLLGELPPTSRLSRNIKVLLDLLRDGSTGTSLLDLITGGERDALVNLANASISTEHQLVAYSLLNVGERFQAQSTMRTAFASARSYKDEYVGGSCE